MVTENYLGRKLKKNEVVHHIDGDRLNNQISNLYLFFKRGLHTSWTNLVKFNIISPTILTSNLKQIRENGDVQPLDK